MENPEKVPVFLSGADAYRPGALSCSGPTSCVSPDWLWDTSVLPKHSLDLRVRHFVLPCHTSATAHKKPFFGRQGSIKPSEWESVCLVQAVWKHSVLLYFLLMCFQHICTAYFLWIRVWFPGGPQSYLPDIHQNKYITASKLVFLYWLLTGTCML